MHNLRLEWHDSFTRYDFGPGHPMSPVRLELTRRLLDELGLLTAPEVSLSKAEVASDELLATVHQAAYLQAVRAASDPSAEPDLRYGLGSVDVPNFHDMHEVSALIAAASRNAALAVWNGEVDHAVNFAGGLHHAMPAAASGFCIYNDIAVAIQSLLDAGAQRVAYVDVDVHHGDGVERIFWNDPRVMTISLHETGQVLFPGTGYPEDIGGSNALGESVNVALPAGTSDVGWLRAFSAVVPPMLKAFRPDFLVTQHGCDSHVLDPLAHMALSLDCQRISYEMLHDLSHELTDGKWLAVGGGGYAVVDVVPRAWAHLVAIAAHRPIDPHTPVPSGWRDYVIERYGHQPPQEMTDGATPHVRNWADGHDTADALDRAVMATRRAVFPLHGLDPWFD